MYTEPQQQLDFNWPTETSFSEIIIVIEIFFEENPC